MTKKADRRQLNKNAGFSLVELLIAVVILAIIVIPLMNLFVSSNRINIKSRKTLRATTAAQDIMEGLKAYDMEEIKAQFKDPASGFYVIDSRLIKGGVAEEPSFEMDGTGNPAQGLYVFSMKDITMQGSEYDAKITVDGRGYMDPALFSCGGASPTASHMYDAAFFDGEKCTVCGAFKGGAKHDGIFNDAALADARSIDKENGTFVEAEKYRQAALKSVFKNSDIKSAIETQLRASGVADADLAAEYNKVKDAVHFKNMKTFFDQVSRTITIDLSTSAEVDEKGTPMVDMFVKQEYKFTYKGKDVPTAGDIDSGVMVAVLDGGVLKPLPCGKIPRITDAAGNQTVNVNLFYYPLYEYSASSPADRIVVNNASGAGLNLLIAKQRHETADPTDPDKVDLSDPEYYSDPQLMAVEQSYRAEIEINDTYGFDADKFTLKTNLGRNLAGEKYVSASPVPGASLEIPTQFSVKGQHLNQLHIFTLDGVRSPLGKAGAAGEITELIYDVEVGIYEKGAADDGFPEDRRMVVIGGSTTN